jgi:hypothetical protein
VVDWLDAVFFCTNYRPVKLEEFVAFGPHVYGLDMPAAATLAAAPGAGTKANVHSGATFQHASTATHSLAASVTADALEAVTDASLSYQRTLAVNVPAKQHFAAQVAVQLALEVAGVRCWPTDLLISSLVSLLQMCSNHAYRACRKLVINSMCSGNMVD